MKRIAIVALLALAACGTQPAEKGPPPPPPYQMRAELAADNRLATAQSGESLFSNRCGSCHLAGGMGTNLLTKQRIAAGQPPETALLANRTDLTRSYVKSVVRGGKMAMPRLTRVDVTDSELDAIAGYLGKAGE